jgi:hypothetical protein
MEFVPKNWRERWVLWLGKRSQSKTSSWLFCLCFYPIATVAGAFPMRRILVQSVAREHLQSVALIIFLLWTIAWFGIIMLWFERRVFYQIIERIRNDKEEENS